MWLPFGRCSSFTTSSEMCSRQSSGRSLTAGPLVGGAAVVGFGEKTGVSAGGEGAWGLQAVAFSLAGLAFTNTKPFHANRPAHDYGGEDADPHVYPLSTYVTPVHATLLCRPAHDCGADGGAADAHRAAGCAPLRQRLLRLPRRQRLPVLHLLGHWVQHQARRHPVRHRCGGKGGWVGIGSGACSPLCVAK